ncbi:MAG: hypothetical protein K6T56_09395 [Burkholderiales bacterium]|jgi:hypothetical protein|nr:hypothetical protein [Burkholderiales bacterium]
MIKWLAQRLFRNRSQANPDTVIIKVRINDQYTFYYPFTARAGMKVREMSAEEFQEYLAAR